MIKKEHIFTILVGFLFLLGVYFTSGGHYTGSVNRTGYITGGYNETNITITHNSTYDMSTGSAKHNWTKSGASFVNFTFFIYNANDTNISKASYRGFDSICVVNITAPSGFSLYSDTKQAVDYVSPNGSNKLSSYRIERFNWSFYNFSSTQLTWFAGNRTDSTGDLDPLTHNASCLKPGNVTALTAAFNVPTVTAETVYTWTIVTTDNATESNTTTLTMGVDGEGPRVELINVTDDRNNKVNDSDLTSGYLKANSEYNVTVTVHDANLNTSSPYSVIIIYNETGGTANFTSQHQQLRDYYNMTYLASKGWNHTYSYTMKKFYNSTNTRTSFIIVTNDTFSQRKEYNNSGATYTITADADPPTIETLNITDTYGNKLVNTTLKNNGYLRTGVDITVIIGLTDERLDVTNTSNTFNRAVLAYNITGGTISVANDVNHHINGTYLGGNAAGTNHTIKFVIPAGWVNNTNLTAFAFVVNDTSGNYLVVNNTAGSSFNFTIDGAAPSITITAPSSTSIDTQSSIKYTCKATDSLSGIQQYTFTLTKPAGTTVTKTTATSATSLEQEFTGTDTNEAGTYTVTCSVKDNIGNIGSSPESEKKTFTAFYTTTGGTTGPSGGGGTTTTPTFDLDLSKATEGSVSGREGHTKTFTFDGTNKHTVKFDKVTDKEATLTISSTKPVSLTLKKRETKEVDMNADGEKDLSVTLSDLIYGKAIVALKMLSGSQKVITEEAKEVTPTPTTEPTTAPGEIPPQYKAGGTTWLWILLAVIVIAVIFYFTIGKKQKK